MIAVHIVTTIADGYVPITLLDAVIPFRSPYRPMWIGFGALAFDMLLAVAISSGVRRRIGAGAWRAVHSLAYLCWPIALVHGLGSGSDARLPVVIAINLACVVSVVGAVAWRLVSVRSSSPAWRIGGGVAGAVGLVAVLAFAVVGPLRPGWSHRAGTSPTLLAQLNGAHSSSASITNAAPNSSSNVSPLTSSPGIPKTPFSTPVGGTVVTLQHGDDANAEVRLTLNLGDTPVPLVVKIFGTATDSGISMQRSTVTFGADTGVITSLSGSNIEAHVNGPSGSINLTLNLVLHSQTGSVTGTVSGSLTT
jgi:sulfoxide reductase heme-binding subunit YedZ